MLKDSVLEAAGAVPQGGDASPGPATLGVVQWAPGAQAAGPSMGAGWLSSSEVGMAKA